MCHLAVWNPAHLVQALPLPSHRERRGRMASLRRDWESPKRAISSEPKAGDATTKRNKVDSHPKQADAARIRGTGRRWPNWLVFRLAVLIDPMMSVNASGC
jgi:hypothetical protein